MSKKNSNTGTISLSATITASSGDMSGSDNKKLNKADGSNEPKKPRTIQVKIGNQAAKEMTPDQAADYLRLLATAGAAAAATAGGGGSGGGGSGRGSGGGGGGTLMPQQVKMTFQNGTTETVPLTSGGGGGTAVSMSISSTSVGGSNLFRSSKSSKKGGGSGSNSSSADVNNVTNLNGGVNNMPCTEKEMKALMSMFVEIMGLQMNTDKLNKQQYKGGKKKKKKKTDVATDTAAAADAAAGGDPKMPGESDDGMAVVPARSKDKKKLFHFPAGLPPPPGGWPQDLLWPNGCASKTKMKKSQENGTANDNNTNEDDEDDDEYESSDDEYADDDSLEDLSSLPDLEDIPPDVRQKAATAAATAALTTRTAALAEAVAQRNGSNNSSSATNATTTSANTLFARKTGLVAGIAVPEWEALERVAMEEALEQEERARKSSKAAASSNSTAASLSTSFLRSTVMEALTTSSSSSSSSVAVAAAAAAAACASSGVSPTAASRAALAAANSQAAAARAAAQAAAALKRRAKAAQVWRTKVIAACQSCDTPTLDRLLKEDSDLRKQLEKQEKESSSTNTNSANNSNNNSNSNPSLSSSPACNDADPTASSLTFDALLPYCLPNTKNHRASLIKTRETRQRLARHLLSICPSRLAKQPLRNNGRTVLHMACMYGDYPLVKQILQANNNNNSSNNNATAPANKSNNSKKPPLPSPTSSSTANNSNTIHDNGLDFPCQDSGWTPLHYAALSGSMQTMELLLSKGANLSAVTDDIHTWWSSTSKGLTPKQLVDVVASGKGEKQVETHGMALSEITKEFLNASSDNGAGIDETTTTAATTTETRKYLAWLQRISQRLATLERAKKNNSSNQHYYTEPSKKELCDWSQEKVQEPTVAAAAAATSTNTNSSSSANTPDVVAVDETTRTKTSVQVKASSKAAPTPMPSSESLPNKTKDDSSESESGTDRPMLAEPTSTASSNIPNESKKRIKKKKKKDGSADSNISINSVTETAPFSANSAVFTAAEDPLVTALKGMGFAERQILAGIQACGGAHRATPDMIVAWIFEQESSGGGGSLDGDAATAKSGGVVSNKKETPMEFTQQKKRGNETKISSNNKPSSSASSSVSSSQHQQEKPGHSTVAAAGTKKTNDAKQREKDLAAKREEQRRRNREWNKKQEAQHVEVVVRSSVVSSLSASSVTNTRAPSPSPALMTGLPAVAATATISTAAASASSSAPASTSLKQPPPGLASTPQTPSMSTMPAVEITTDASTIASSVGDFLNDDATISTIGSRTTNTQHSILPTFSNNGGNSAAAGLPYPQHLHHHHQQVLQPQSQQQHMPVAPPGFGPSVAAVPESVPVADENWHQASLGLGQRLYAPPGSSMAPPPPGIAGSRPFVDQRAQASSLTAASMGSLQSRMSAAHEAFAGSFPARAPNVLPQQQMSSSSIRGVSVGSSGFGSSSLFGLPTPAPVLHHQSMSSISDPSFVATSSSTMGSHPSMDPSSLIESMATGNAPIGGASLWGGHDQHQMRSTAGSSLLGGPPAHSGGPSLLGNLIQTNQARQVDSLFSFDNQTSSLSGWGDNNPNNPNFSSNSGIGGHPVGDSSSNQRGSHGNIW